MKKIFAKLFFICLLLLNQLTVKAQLLDKIAHSFGFYHQNNFQEKLFVHTDKEQYIASELLWFKLYVVSAPNFIPTDLSKVAYIELITQNNEVVLQAKIALEKGVGSGSFVIPSNIANGKYKLRAYTNWMKNYGPSSFFEKQISIYNVQKSPSIPTSVVKSPSIQFFPEGGDLINGISNYVGFKVISTDGRGIDVKGFIVNKKNDTLARFKSLKFGIGKFNFTPVNDEVYRAILVSKSDGVFIKKLPEAKAQGYAMALHNTENNLILDVNTNLKDDKVFLFVHSGSKTTFSEIGKINNGKAVFTIDKNKLEDRISYLTVFNESGQAVCERLYFKKTNQKLNIEISTKPQFKTREKINVALAISDSQGQAINGSFSIAVRKLDSLQLVDEVDMVSYFSLSAELKGNIESPSYYFNNNNPEVDLALDNLVLTQGWRKFNWSEVLNEQIPKFKFLPEVDGHLITGKINNKNGSVAKYRQLFLSVPANRNQFYDGESDTSGHFLFNTKGFYGKNEIVVQTESDDTTSVIEINTPFSNQYTPIEISDFKVKTNLINELQELNLSVQVQNAYAADRLKKFTLPIVDTIPFYGKPYKTYKFADYTLFSTMEETLRSYITETFVRGKQNNYSVRLLGKEVALEDNPLVLLDGIPYFDINKAMQIDPKKIEKLEIIPENYYYGSSQYAGILSFFSIKNNLANAEINPNAIVLDYDGLQLQREFYVPTYDSEAQRSSRIPDFRNVLYWSPKIAIDANGKGQINFYSSDLKGTYIGVVNGLTDNGLFGSSSFKFEVVK